MILYQLQRSRGRVGRRRTLDPLGVLINLTGFDSRREHVFDLPFEFVLHDYRLSEFGGSFVFVALL